MVGCLATCVRQVQCKRLSHGIVYLVSRGHNSRAVKFKTEVNQVPIGKVSRSCATVCQLRQYTASQCTADMPLSKRSQE